MTSKTGYHHGELRDAALAAAMATLDSERRLPALREIAATCGVSHAALYRHFANLEALALDLAAICFQELAAAIREAVAGASDPVDRLRRGCHASIAWGLAHPGRYLFMTGPELAGKQHHQAFFSAAREAFGLLVEAVAGVGVAESVPVAHTALAMLHGFIDFTCKGRTVPFEAESLEGQIERLVNAVVGFTLRSVPGAETEAPDQDKPAGGSETEKRGRSGPGREAASASGPGSRRLRGRSSGRESGGRPHVNSGRRSGGNGRGRTGGGGDRTGGGSGGRSV